MVVFLVGVLALIVSGCADNRGLSGEAAATADGFVIELADEVGPDAFTAPIDTAPTADADSGACDAGALLEQLESRPDAYREWAAVLGIPEDQVPDYIATLEPRILESDTDVTNHGLRDGRAYARPSQLAKGTAVLVDTNFSGFPPGPDTLATTTTTAGETTTTGAETTTTTVGTTTTGVATTAITPGTSTPGDGQEQPVTRCKCGNPLLPPYQPSTPAPATTLATTPTTSTTTTATVPRTTGGTPGSTPPLTTTIPVITTTSTTIPTTTTTAPPPTSGSTTSAPTTTPDDDSVGILRIPTRHGP